MERESFEDNDVADILNKYFISIKVDREERPDIDSIYMSFCQTLTGQGGWPLTIIMTPQKRPFYAGTYFPKESKYGRPGLIDILEEVLNIWSEKREDVEKSSQHIYSVVSESLFTNEKSEMPKNVINDIFGEMKDMFDNIYGGFGNAPKFPTTHNLSFLLRYYKATGKKEALEIVEKTLDSMYKGGIFDHIGFGFSRYSTDQKWLVPHFEKMLYDNALIAIAYLEAYQLTRNNRYKEIVDKIFTYVIRDMTSGEGGFYSAEDADSEGEEGKFYVWSVEEIELVLGREYKELFCKYYDITEEGNFEGKSIPNLINTSLDKIENNIELKGKLDKCIDKLFRYRLDRIHPHKDDKILTSWNGLMIAAMAYGGRVLNNLDYINASKKAADFVLNNLKREDGRLLARYRDGEAAHIGTIDDYAFMIWGLIELYETTFDILYLQNAIDLNNDMITLFWDENEGGLFITGKDSEELVIRPKEIYDGATPSGNSVATMNMLRLAKLTGNAELEEKAMLQFNVFSGKVQENPSSYSYFIIAFLFANIATKEVIIAGDRGNKDTQNMLRNINDSFLPFTTFILNDENPELYNQVPFIKNQGMIDDKTTAYVCEDFSCNKPTSDVEHFIKLLNDANYL
ncbi:thioredoxin domain-containing protein [Tepidibacter mesophilus]|uniref:thioredoxin domain-containing protein n=1 Tax=Tepidibacter mesophilus TaxID=655607 RepID=UPI002FE6432E